MAPSAEFPRRGPFIGSVNLTEVAPARAAGAARATSAGKRFIHDPSDGARAPSTLGAAAEAAIDMARGPTRRGIGRGSHLVVAQYVAGTNNHQAPYLGIRYRVRATESK